MIHFETLLAAHIQQALSSVFGIAAEKIALQTTKPEFEGSHTWVSFPFAKATGQSPEALGKAVGEYLVQHADFVANFNVVKGFLNISLRHEAWLQFFNTLQQMPDFGQAAPKQQKVMVEFSSPNTNKPLHLGHLRNNFLGDSLARILTANGYEVIRAQLVNDRGIHICKSMLAYQQAGQAETPENSQTKGDHLVAKYYVAFEKLYQSQIQALVAEGMPKEQAEKQAPAMQEARELLQKWENGDPETLALWRKMNGWVYAGFDKTYQNIGVRFDKVYYESETYLLGKSIVDEGLANGVFFKKPDGSVWIDLKAEKLDEKLLLRNDGTSVYITQDLGTADMRFQALSLDKCIYVVGNEQDYHFKVLFAILHKLGRTYGQNGLFHLSYGMVDLPSGRMKTREGTVVDADELLADMIDTARQRTDEKGVVNMEDFSQADREKLYHQIGLGAMKYYLLKVEPKKRMLFNPEESIDFQGDACPFVQYNYARTRAILRKAEDLGIKHQTTHTVGTLQPAELHLLHLFYDYPATVQQAADSLEPSLLVQYAYQLAKGYSQFFAECPIFKAETPELCAFRVALSAQAGELIRKSLGLLGIESPERM